MKNYPTIHSHMIISLPHVGVCGIIGIAPNLHIYAEEIHPPYDMVSHHIIDQTGKIIHSADEDSHPSITFPKSLISPVMPSASHPLNYRGGRLRGMREAERLSDWARPFPIAEKMTLINTLGLSINAMQLFGMIQSTALSMASLGNGWFVVCRRIVLALALSQVAYDKDHIPYDYDGHTLQTAHLYHESWEEAVTVEALLKGIGDIRLSKAHDCVVYEDKLYISNSGGDDTNNTIHQWSIAHPPKTD